MVIAEPPRTQGDLNFSLLGIPVRVHPMFWLIAFFLGWGGDNVEPLLMVIWVAVVFVSILVHELGHALIFIYYGGRPWITLHGIGGLTSCDRRPHSVLGAIVLSFAGPAAGFMLAAAVLAAFVLAGFQVNLVPNWIPFRIKGVLANAFVKYAAMNLLIVNILWGLFNLLPIYPLDGGQISREVLMAIHPRGGLIWSLGISMTVAAALVVYGIKYQQYFMAALFAYLAYSSFAALQAYQRWDGP